MPGRDLHSTPKRPLVLRLLTLAITLVGGAVVGQLLAERLAPDSQLAVIPSFVLLPAILVIGFHTWLGVAVILLIPRLFGRAARRPPAIAADRQFVPPGAWTFLPVGTVFGLGAGLAIGFLFAAGSALYAAAAYWAAGTIYGAALWFLARTGYLPFPEEE
jgi:hypothetical protein